jgi:uncharacterized protein (DUF433 family)
MNATSTDIDMADRLDGLAGTFHMPLLAEAAAELRRLRAENNGRVCVRPDPIPPPVGGVYHRLQHAQDEARRLSDELDRERRGRDEERERCRDERLRLVGLIADLAAGGDEDGGGDGPPSEPDARWIDNCSAILAGTAPDRATCPAALWVLWERLVGPIARRRADEPEPAEPDRPRLVFDPAVSDSSPVVRGTTVTAALVARCIAGGWTWPDILRNHPSLTEADIRACLTHVIESEDAHADKG